jgi:cytochrome P450
MATFFLAMLCYPEVQEKAFAEVERVLGPNRLPTFEDKSNLPYITAIMKESLRYG